MKTFKNYVSTVDEERLNDYFLNENESEEINEGLLGWFINKFKVGEGTKKVIKGLGKAGVKFAEYQATLEKIRSGKSDDKIGKTIGDELKETGKIEDPKELLERHMKMIKDNEDDFKKSPCGVALAMTAFELACAVKDNDAKDYLTKFIKDSSNDAKKEVKDTAGKVRDGQQDNGKEENDTEAITQATSTSGEGIENIANNTEDDKAKKALEEQVKRLEAEKKALEQAVKEKEEKAATKVWNDLWDTSLRGYEEGENDFENAEDENAKQGIVDAMYVNAIYMKKAAEQLNDKDKQEKAETAINDLKKGNDYKDYVKQAAKDTHEVNDGKNKENEDKTEGLSDDDLRAFAKNIGIKDIENIEDIKKAINATLKTENLSDLSNYVQIYESALGKIQTAVKDNKELQKLFANLTLCWEQIRKIASDISPDGIKAFLDSYANKLKKSKENKDKK